MVDCRSEHGGASMLLRLAVSPLQELALRTGSLGLRPGIGRGVHGQYELSE